MKYQYVGKGEDSPEKINFMGKVEFELNGDPVEVTDRECLSKLKDHPCFVEAKEGAGSKTTKKKTASKPTE